MTRAEDVSKLQNLCDNFMNLSREKTIQSQKIITYMIENNMEFTPDNYTKTRESIYPPTDDSGESNAECEHQNLDYTLSDGDGQPVTNSSEIPTSSIMQPTEAIRWMRENPGKVIVAVEDKYFMYKFNKEENLYMISHVLEDNGKWFNFHRYMNFFAYTYRIVKE